MNRYKIGYYYERKVVQYFRKAGWDVWRTPKSGSSIDVIAIKNIDNTPKIKLIQIKATSNENFSFNNLSREERAKLLELAHRYANNDYVDIELWIFFRKFKKRKIIDVKSLLKNL